MNKTPENSPKQQNQQVTPTEDDKKEENKGKTPVVPLPHETPAAVRTRRNVQAELHIGSPSDNMLSPCTSKLFGKKKAVSGPTAILRNKQQSTIPFKLDDE
ncbi:unnamed protein product [Caenorhabditis angaria]|uniref:Uncharacterized protein n=1 Tax=Caenorhabditis angaria TaxID=860376 RepID=A0A9P1IPQ9_9PELO|nr:unnamed protein product [Caenorhabditis angaria]